MDAAKDSCKDLSVLQACSVFPMYRCVCACRRTFESYVYVRDNREDQPPGVDGTQLLALHSLNMTRQLKILGVENGGTDPYM